MKKSTLQMMALGLMLCFSISAIAQTDNEIKQKIEKINMEMAKAMIAGNDTKNLQFYSDNVVSMPSYGEMVNGKEGVRKAMEEMASTGWKIKDVTFETVSVETNGNVITEIGKYNMEMKKDGMDQTMKDKGKYLTQWEKQSDGSLKIKTEIWNTDKNPWEEMSAMQKEHKNMMGEKQDNDNDIDRKDKKTEDELRPEKQDNK
ncbi:MAG TPA: DUF4440 domain-containing protein [Lentimicrobium sp.]|nr:DUF4440 domain-containing protein [Lentimicrobium sp.]